MENDNSSMHLQIQKHIEIKGKEGHKISKILSEVAKEFEVRDHIRKLKKIQVFVTKDPVKVCERIITPKTKLKVHGEMREWICNNAPSFSYWGMDDVSTIMLSANQDIFKKKNYNAIKGLFAHELMHLLAKVDGLDEALDEQIAKATKNILIYLEKHKEVKPFTKERLFVSLVRVTTTASLLTKDVLINSRAMSFGFDREIYENYKATLTDVKNWIKYKESDIIAALKKDEKHVLDDAFLTYLGLNVGWITFKMFHNMWYKELQYMASIQVPQIIRRNCKPILNEMLNLRFASKEKNIAKILRLTQQNYFNTVQYFCKKLR